MTTFVSRFLPSFVMFTAILLVVAVPAFVAARRRRRSSTIRNLTIGALSIGAILAIIQVASEISVEQCLNAGNTQCVDFGSSGMAVLFSGGFTVVAWGRAWSLSR